MKQTVAQLSLSLSLSALLFLMHGCSTAPEPELAPPKQGPAINDTTSPEQLLQMGLQSPSPKREALLFMASTRAINESNAELAKRILTHLNFHELNYSDKATYVSQLTQAALLQHDADAAIRLFDDPAYQLSTFYNQLSPTEKANLGQLRAQAFELSGRAVEAIMERIHLTPLVTQTDQGALLQNNNAIWRSLMSLSPEALQALEEAMMQQYTPNQELAGWLALANIHKAHSEDLATRLTKIRQWQNAWQSHPASNVLPADLAALIEAAKHQPEKVALILPQSGKLQTASQIFMDGFMSAYYYAHSQHIETPSIEVFDSTAGDIIDVYNAAIQAGAEMIIGPLDKIHVQRLSEYEELPVPTLALNYLDPSVLSPLQLYQFGLAAEDEVKQIAERAFLENHLHAAVIYPDNEWGQRTSKAFTESWEALTGKVVTKGGYKGNGDFSSLISKMLSITASKQRAKKLRGFLGQKLEFQPRRRQDIDFIVMLGHPRDARQIVPTLAFHYAGNLPVYSTSSVYSGRPNPVGDRDLNGVTYLELPWVLNDNDPVKEYLRQQIPHMPPTLTRLRAMGADAYRLHQQLAVLTMGSNTAIKGSTGQLSIRQNNRIQRRSEWAIFKLGKVKIDNTAPTVHVNESTHLPDSSSTSGH